MKRKQTSQPSLFPVIKTAHGHEQIWATDSAGSGHFFARKANSNDLFYSPAAGLPRHPRGFHGPGEYVNEFGEVIKTNPVPDWWRLCPLCNQIFPWGSTLEDHLREVSHD